MASDYSRAGACWTEAIIPTSVLRISAGVCTLVVGLFIGSAGAVAAADSETAGSSTPSQGTTGTDDGQQVVQDKKKSENYSVIDDATDGDL